MLAPHYFAFFIRIHNRELVIFKEISLLINTVTNFHISGSQNPVQNEASSVEIIRNYINLQFLVLK